MGASAWAVGVLAAATGAWFLGWCLDVGTTWRGLRASGGQIALEQNPIARVAMRRFGVPGGFLALGLVEGLVVALHWVCALAWNGPGAGWPSVAGAAASLGIGGLGHAMAARANATGRIPSSMLPLLRLYHRLGRWWGV